MKKLKSKRGLTLVELLVTVAVLGIVSGFSITIVVTAMNNYTEAAIVQKEEETALMIEDYIVRNARVARKVEFIKNDPTDPNKTDVPSKNYQGFYLAKTDNVISTFDYAGISADYFDYESSSPQQYTIFTYENVQKIILEFSRQKYSPDDIELKCVYCMDYTITMMSGYTLKGQVVMNNANADYLGKLAGDGDNKGQTEDFVDTLASYKLIEVTEGDGYVFDPDYDAAVVFR